LKPHQSKAQIVSTDTRRLDAVERTRFGKAPLLSGVFSVLLGAGAFRVVEED